MKLRLSCVSFLCYSTAYKTKSISFSGQIGSYTVGFTENVDGLKLFLAVFYWGLNINTVYALFTVGCVVLKTY